MFTLKLDLILTYTPPMKENAGGIHLTRDLQIPFPPHSGLHVCGKSLDQAADSEGFVLKDVTWDVDQQHFLARTKLISHDLPMQDIPLDLAAWVELGWSLGSYADSYESLDETDDDEVIDGADESEVDDRDWETVLLDRTRAPRERTRQFNQVMRAMVRVMAENYNAMSAAYAMDKTKRYYLDHELKGDDSAPAAKWREAVEEFLDMSAGEQMDWRERVMCTHPRIDRLVSRA